MSVRGGNHRWTIATIPKSKKIKSVGFIDLNGCNKHYILRLQKPSLHTYHLTLFLDSCSHLHD